MLKILLIGFLFLSSCCFSPCRSCTYHLVKKGDTWKSISVKYYGSSLNVDHLRETNGELVIGERVLIPVMEF
jgi:nucleoid-associated protein YgaU